MKHLMILLAHLRSVNRCELKYKKALRHVHHGFHSSYLGWYVIDWHIPVSVIALPLLILALASWLFHLELD